MELFLPAWPWPWRAAKKLWKHIPSCMVPCRAIPLCSVWTIPKPLSLIIRFYHCLHVINRHTRRVIVQLAPLHIHLKVVHVQWSLQTRTSLPTLCSKLFDTGSSLFATAHTLLTRLYCHFRLCYRLRLAKFSSVAVFPSPSADLITVNIAIRSLHGANYSPLLLLLVD